MGTNTMAESNFLRKEKVQSIHICLEYWKAGDFASWTRKYWSWISCKMITNLWNATYSYAAKIFQSDMQIPISKSLDTSPSPHLIPEVLVCMVIGITICHGWFDGWIGCMKRWVHPMGIC